MSVIQNSIQPFVYLTNLIFRYGDLANITKAKEDLVRRLRLLMEEERRQLEQDLGQKLEQLDLMKKRHRVNSDKN